LAYLHGQNIWHRVRAPVDVEQPTNERPGSQSDNILVDANGICKISDFGTRRRPQMTPTTHLVTPPT
jgi:serine/threonine protein kinase